MAFFRPFTTLAVATLFASAALGQPLIVDSFESGDMSATNEDGFDWGANNRTSVVTADAAVYNNKTIENPIGSDQNWNPKDGEHSLRFRYPAGQPMAEQRFNLGKHYRDVWVTYWIRVPFNFTQGSLNSKFLALWPSTYDRPGTVTWQTRPNGNGGANLVYQDGGVTGGEIGSAAFISVPDDRGRWMQVAAHVKASSGPSANDGIIQLFRRWEGADSFTKIHEKLTADTWDDSSSQQGLSQGYIMGWANDPYDQDTEWLLDEFAVYTESPIDNVFISERPNPPTLTLR
ncbi:hypothetical protein [Marinobacter subterrani]|uniref:Polysaccharide lyase n=1 Tax=Marinobacter subterrani TaxID=1658765 RepID=A0A0J7J9R2_9GAMM|nr:hypothetical protein [Marinobacter subterrani]KMQ74616.1 hypothetical protein Msub_10802 [Marinobacter subterrani]